MRKAAAPPLLFAALLCLSSCSYGLGELFGREDSVASRADELSDRDPEIAALKASLASAIPPGTAFRFLIASDLHFGLDSGPREAALEAFRRLAADSGADFILFGGDYADKGRESEFQAFRAYADSLRAGAASHLGAGAALPWFAAIGNHDLYNSGWRYFKKYLGPSRLRLSAGSMSVYIVDTASGTLGEGQLEELGSRLSSDTSPKLVLSHYPVHGSAGYGYYRITDTRERAQLLDLFNARGVRLLACGHWHHPLRTSCGSFDECVTGSLWGPSASCALVSIAPDGSLASYESRSF